MRLLQRRRHGFLVTLLSRDRIPVAHHHPLVDGLRLVGLPGLSEIIAQDLIGLRDRQRVVFPRVRLDLTVDLFELRARIVPGRARNFHFVKQQRPDPGIGGMPRYKCIDPRFRALEVLHPERHARKTEFRDDPVWSLGQILRCLFIKWPRQCKLIGEVIRLRQQQVLERHFVIRLVLDLVRQHLDHVTVLPVLEKLRGSPCLGKSPGKQHAAHEYRSETGKPGGTDAIAGRWHDQKVAAWIAAVTTI